MKINIGSGLILRRNDLYSIFGGKRLISSYHAITHNHMTIDNAEFICAAIKENMSEELEFGNTIFQSETDIHLEVVKSIQTAGLDALKKALKQVRDLGEAGKLNDKINMFGEQGLRADNDKVFAGPLGTVKFKTNPHNAVSSAIHYVDLATGRYDAVCEHTRKRSLELPTAYRLVAEAGGFMGAVIDEELVNFANQNFLTFGQDRNIPVIAAATQELARAIVMKITYNNQL